MGDSTRHSYPKNALFRSSCKHFLLPHAPVPRPTWCVQSTRSWNRRHSNSISWFWNSRGPVHHPTCYYGSTRWSLSSCSTRTWSCPSVFHSGWCTIDVRSFRTAPQLIQWRWEEIDLRHCHMVIPTIWSAFVSTRQRSWFYLFIPSSASTWHRLITILTLPPSGGLCVYTPRYTGNCTEQKKWASTDLLLSDFRNKGFCVSETGDHPCIVCDGPAKRPQYMRISRLITVTYLFFSNMARG